MTRKFKVYVSYPWTGIEDDVDAVEIGTWDDEDTLSKEEIEKTLFEYAQDMIWNRLNWCWEEVTNGES